jgi:hypothetical protein
MQRGRLGGIPLPRTFPIRDGGIGSRWSFACGYSWGGRERFGGAPRCYCARVRPTRSAPPEWPPPRAEAKDKKVRAPPARASPNGPGGPQHRLPTVQNYFDIGNATQASLTAAKASEFSGSRRKSESDSGAGGKKSKVLLLGPMAKKQGFVARSPCWLVHNIMPCRPTR